MRKIFFLSAPNVVALSLCLVTLAVNIAMPLFRVYAFEAGLSNGQTSLVLSSYIAGMLPCYVFAGGISDRIGRKPVMIASIIFAMLSTIALTIFPNVWSLIFARICQGIGLGLSMGAGTAYMAELMQNKPGATTKAANLASLFTSIGFGGGALLTSILVIQHFTHVPVSYYVLIAITIIGLIMACMLPSLKPIGGSFIRLPYFPKGSLPVNLSICICWAATGVVIAIIPAQLATYKLVLYAGFCLVLINWSGALIQPVIRQMNPVYSLRVGFILVPIGFGLVIAGCYTAKLLIILAGTATIGLAAYGFSYVAGLSIIANLGGIQKARAVSGYMFFGYLGFGIPAIFLGYLADYAGIINALLVFEGVVLVLSLILLFTYKIPKANT